MPRLPHSRSHESLIDRLGLNAIPSELPCGTELYARTPDFTPDTLPGELRCAHATEDGVWGVIQVVEGTLLYRLEAPLTAEVSARAGSSVVIEPQTLHSMEFLTPGRFFIEFHLMKQHTGVPHTSRPQ